MPVVAMTELRGTSEADSTDLPTASLTGDLDPEGEDKDDSRVPAFHCHLLWIYLGAFLSFVSFAMTIVAIVQIINLKIAGGVEIVTAESAKCLLTVQFLTNTTKFLTTKYNTAITDNLGRKPMLIAACLCYIASRIVFLVSETQAGFYIAAVVSGVFDSFYYISIAWVCDIAKVKERGRALGLLTGISVGLAFTIGVPVGAVLGQFYSPQVPIIASCVFAGLALLTSVYAPADDMRGVLQTVKEKEEEDRMRGSSMSSMSTVNVSLPPPLPPPPPSSSSSTSQFASGTDLLKRKITPPEGWTIFFKTHHPFSGLGLINKAKHPSDWLTNIVCYISQSVLQTIFILYCISVFGWSTVVAGGALCFVGIGIAIASPSLLTLYKENALVSWGLVWQCGGFIMYSIAGIRGENKKLVVVLAIVGCTLFVLGGVWLTAMTTVLTKQYSANEQGSVTGVFGQQQAFAFLPAYPITLLFAFALEAKDSQKIWPGITFVVNCILVVIGLMIYVYNNGFGVLMLQRQTKSSNQVHVDPRINSSASASSAGSEVEVSASPMHTSVVV